LSSAAPAPRKTIRANCRFRQIADAAPNNPFPERFGQVAAVFAGSATAGRILPAMISSTYQGFRTAPIPSGLVQTAERWDLWWNERSVANITPAPGRGVRLHLNGRKVFETKNVFGASVSQGKRYAERWCAARLYSDLPLREAVARLIDSTPIQPAPPPPGLPPTREQQQQARRLAEATPLATARVKEAFEPAKLPATKPRQKDARKAWVRAGLQQLRRGV
jgi:hypothetical protein